MAKAAGFQQWLERHGATIEVAQENDGSGYVVFWVTLPGEAGLPPYDVTVQE